MERARDWREPVHRRGADLQSVVIVCERRRRRPWCLVSQVFHTTQVQLAHGEPLVPPTCSPRTVAWPTRRPRKENRWSGARAISLYQSAFGKTQTIFDLLHRGVTRDFFFCPRISRLLIILRGTLPYCITVTRYTRLSVIGTEVPSARCRRPPCTAIVPTTHPTNSYCIRNNNVTIRYSIIVMCAPPVHRLRIGGQRGAPPRRGV